MVKKLRERQCRMTPQRVALLRLLAASEGIPVRPICTTG